MKKKLLLRLCLILTVSLSLYSCTNEDLYSSAENEKQEVASKSPWKEDQVYIKKVQKVFLQNANVQYFERKYGTVHWDYAMSFGQFDESYLVVPILKGNTVVTAMKVYRIDDRVYFREKNDPEFISFFTDIMFKEISGIDEKVVYSPTSSASKAIEYKCTYRTFTVGCFESEPNCDPISRTIRECNWVDTGDSTGPPRMELCDPLLCGDGGGPDPGILYPEPPEDKTPCEKISTIGNKDKTKNLFENLKKKTNSTKEFGEILQESNGGINNTSVEGEIGQAGIDIDFAGGKIDGFIHSHYPGLLSIFSPGDLASLSTLLVNNNIKDVNTFILGVVTASNTQYIMVIDDPYAFAVFAQQFLLPNGQIDEDKTDVFGLFDYAKYNVHKNNLASTNELGFIKLLSDKNSGLKVLKGSNNSNNWTELNIKNGQIDPKPCN